jgi:hypothetical protein
LTADKQPVALLAKKCHVIKPLLKIIATITSYLTQIKIKISAHEPLGVGAAAPMGCHSDQDPMDIASHELQAEVAALQHLLQFQSRPLQLQPLLLQPLLLLRRRLLLRLLLLRQVLLHQLLQLLQVLLPLLPLLSLLCQLLQHLLHLVHQLGISGLQTTATATATATAPAPDTAAGTAADPQLLMPLLPQIRRNNNNS